MLGLLATAGRAITGRLDRQRTLATVLRAARTRLPGAGIDPLDLPPALAGQLAAGPGAVAGQQPSVLGELGLMAIQLWHAHAGAGPNRPAGERTVVFTDLSGFSEWTLQVGDQTAVAALRRINATIEPLLAARGTLVKRLGDGLMIVYARPDDAVHAALAARDAVAELDLGGHRHALRAGIHTGRPTPLGGDFYGRDVNIAARLADLAGPGEIAVSETTRRRLSRPAVQHWPRTRPRVMRTPGLPAHLTAHILPHPNPLTAPPNRRPGPNPGAPGGEKLGGDPGGEDTAETPAPMGIEHPEDVDDGTLMCSIGILMERYCYHRSEATLLLLDWAHDADLDPDRLARFIVEDTNAAHRPSGGSITGH